jgi:hypothetical protein
VKEPPGSLSRLIGILDRLWEDHGCKEKEIPMLWRDGAGRDESRIEIERGLRSLASGDEVPVCPSLAIFIMGKELMRRINILSNSCLGW